MRPARGLRTSSWATRRVMIITDKSTHSPVQISCQYTSWLCVPLCRLCLGEGLHYAWLHAEAREPVPHSVAAPILLSVPQPCGVEGRGRHSGESASQHTLQIHCTFVRHVTAYHGLRAFGLFIIWSVCLSLCLCSFHSEGEVAKTSEKAERLGECYHQAQVPAVSSAPLLFRVVVCLPAWKLVVSQLQFLLFVDLVLWYCKRVRSCAQFWVDHPPQTCSHAFLHVTGSRLWKCLLGVDWFTSGQGATGEVTGNRRIRRKFEKT